MTQHSYPCVKVITNFLLINFSMKRYQILPDNQFFFSFIVPLPKQLTWGKKSGRPLKHGSSFQVTPGSKSCNDLQGSPVPLTQPWAWGLVPSDPKTPISPGLPGSRCRIFDYGSLSLQAPLSSTSAHGFWFAHIGSHWMTFPDVSRKHFFLASKSPFPKMAALT